MKGIAVASIGGHWIQLLRLNPAFKNHEMVYVSTNSNFSSMVPNNKFYFVDDFNRKEKVKIFKAFFKIYKILKLEKAEFIITTGAAPGLICLFVGWILGCKTIWVDSIANVEKISLSGKLATMFASRVYSQWPDLAKKGIHYSGNVIS
ncbi:Oligosaccharide biosynthesis protein Alg14 like [bacterium A37T11]|nr:Oligosaccharide biosynthesis protein Alg14 like [bacterium A37T11]